MSAKRVSWTECLQESSSLDTYNWNGLKMISNCAKQNPNEMEHFFNLQCIAEKNLEMVLFQIP